MKPYYFRILLLLFFLSNFDILAQNNSGQSDSDPGQESEEKRKNYLTISITNSVISPGFFIKEKFRSSDVSLNHNGFIGQGNRSENYKNIMLELHIGWGKRFMLGGNIGVNSWGKVSGTWQADLSSYPQPVEIKYATWMLGVFVEYRHMEGYTCRIGPSINYHRLTEARTTSIDQNLTRESLTPGLFIGASMPVKTSQAFEWRLNMNYYLSGRVRIGPYDDRQGNEIFAMDKFLAHNLTIGTSFNFWIK